jgi:hypothetical protein
MTPSPFAQILTSKTLPGQLSQGDVLKDLPSAIAGIFVPKPVGLVVASNTCDLVQRGRMSFLFVSPIYRLDLWIGSVLRQRLEKIRNDGGVTPDYDQAVEHVTGKLQSLANYQDKWLYFIPPHKVLDNSATFVSMDQTSPTSVELYDQLLAARVATIKTPWKEKFGFKVGYLFNRVATPTPDYHEVREWLHTSYGVVIREILEA